MAIVTKDIFLLFRLFNAISFDYNMKEVSDSFMEKCDNALIKRENRVVWHTKQDNNTNDKTQIILFRLKQLFVFWSP